MKKDLLLWVSLSLGVVAFTGCSNDDDNGNNIPGFPQTETTYDGSHTLYTYNGKPKANIIAVFTPVDATKGTLTLSYPGGRSDILVPSESADLLDESNVVPGTSLVTIPVELVKDKDGATFSGQSSADFCKFYYSGRITPQLVSVNVDKVVMNDGLIVSELTYTDNSGLKLDYNGSPLYGKKIVYTPDYTDLNRATITLTGDKLVLPDMPEGNDMLDQIIPILNTLDLTTCGVLPGSPVLELEVEPVNGEFSGEGETEYVTYKYSGKVSADAAEIVLSDVRLKNTTLADTSWKPNDAEPTDDDPVNTFHIVWDSSKDLDLFGSPMPVADMVKLIFIFPILNDMSMSLSDAFKAALLNVSFGADGNITATYMPGGAEAGTQPAHSPVNLAHYVVTDDNKIRVFVNPQAIMLAVSQSQSNARSRADEGAGIDLTGVIQWAMTEVLPMLSNGAELTYTVENERMDIYFGSEFLKPMLNLLAPIIASDEFVKVLLGMMGDDMAGMEDLIVPILSQLPDIVEATNKVELGIALRKTN